jgi:hypothetical protein
MSIVTSAVDAGGGPVEDWSVSLENVRDKDLTCIKSNWLSTLNEIL